jgi:hypothetical protein
VVDENEKLWLTTAERVLEMMRSGDAAAAFDYLDHVVAETGAAGHAAVAPPGFREVARHLYWKHKALPEFVRLSQETIRRLEAAVAADPGKEALIRPLAGTYFDLASFTWPGWEEPGILIGPEELVVGRHAADRCLEIRRDPAHAGMRFGYSLPMAHWVVGAYRLQERDWEGARAHFGAARQLNRDANADDSLEAGYLCLVDLLERPGDPEAARGFDTTIAAFDSHQGDEDAACYRTQLLTARRVFS